MIRIQGLHKYFNRGKQNEIHVINDVSLDLPEKGMVAIFGKSGCGKTTLLNVIGGLDGFAEGTLTIEGQGIQNNTDVIRNQYIGYIFQNYNLNKAESCFDNVADALRLCGLTDENEIEARVTAALKNVGMDKYAKRTPDTLSGGQQQRIAIARAIVKNPRIILADEPTGNLDETNTVMIMDLLKAIAKDHLVLLVTHEANLVDYYCDTVIELQDGKVIGQTENTDAFGFAARDKNDIFLGELEKREIADESAKIEYYGDLPASPIKLRIVNSGGKLYVSVGTEKVQILDESSEIKLREGVYHEKAQQNAASTNIDMSALPPVKGERFGRLFSLKSSLKSGYRALMQGGKRGKKSLRRCMSLFSIVIVLMSAVFGSAFGDIAEAKAAYNHNVFYVNVPTEALSEKLVAAAESGEGGIDFVRLTPFLPSGDDEIAFRTGTFETFLQYDFESNFKTNAVYLDMTVAEGLELVAGRKDNLSDADVLISTKVADALLEKSTLGYITEREDLLGLVNGTFKINNEYPRIAGILESDEPAIYLSELAMAKYVRAYNAATSNAALASLYGMEVTPGEAILIVRHPNDKITYPKAGETIRIQGRDIKVKAVRIAYSEYGEWLKANGFQKMDDVAYFSSLVKEENPTLVEGTDAFNEAFLSVKNARYFEYYDYYYSQIDAYLKDWYFFSPNTHLELWLYNEKGIDLAKYAFMPEDYFEAVCYKEENGAYPSYDEMMENPDAYPSVYNTLAERIDLQSYENEFLNRDSYGYDFGNAYMVHESDYIAFSKQIGETHPSARGGYYAYDVKMEDSIVVDGADPEHTNYVLVHSFDPEKTAAFLSEAFANVTALPERDSAVLSPDDLFAEIIASKTPDIISSIVTLALVIILMSVCMYFIMRSSLLNRIKEVGIYRAIGVSKKNLVFKFFIEAIVLTVLTVLIGYLASSAFLWLCIGMSSLVAEIFFYPLWMALAVLALLAMISLFFGTLPILTLLRSTPSEILAKYDI